MSKPATLARCGLVVLLPRTLEAVRKGWGGEQRNDPTPLGQAHALREALVAAIEQLKAGDEEAAEQSLPYLILHQEYVLGTATKRIMVRYAVSEATLHRRRQEGIRALAVELSTRERLLAHIDAPVTIPLSADGAIRPMLAKLIAWVKGRPSRANVLLLLGGLFFELLRWATKELLTDAWAGWTRDKIADQLGSVSMIGLWVIDAALSLPPFLILSVALGLAWGLSALGRVRASTRKGN